MENVDRAQKSFAYKCSRDILKAAGYGITEIVLNASFTGVPQNRKRFFSIGCLGENDQFLLSELNKGLSKEPTTVREYLGKELDIEHYYRHPRNYNRRGIFSIDEPAPTVRGVNRPLPKGYPGHHGDTANTDNIRPLSTLERARLQTFPKEFIWNGTKTDLEQLIGNAVPVELAKYVGDAILSYQKKSNYFSINGLETQFKLWLQQEKKLQERSVSDVVSRYKRALKLEPSISHASDTNEANYLLSKSKNFTELNNSLQSQLKRSLRLVNEYKQL